ncbi:MAG: (2Fe-2S)-binding protein [Pseudomonas sp.]|jgi:isoquinoline 1-oxidoreductase alpha subunit|uniref:(2Fe-2S)-binding protein n=1 Tax=unclassified Pseudomonas TaxID=196821 RepID=UPI001C5713FF|nr:MULTISPECIES: (2Fe-2S)-binding protein [unclassified Pseudomonas]MEB0007463.1 (2Fe-2S)-binding protein [Pseudomonas sp. RTB2]MEB0018959.1 (2Fe-2S)-binding protein [Pseudomonas sp. RTB3]MEB0148955.1 (2Fe-2S)-binding protein [Pseudomonas sp. CCC2.2]MEB0270813.1 (2Fe-2S)-binding protein [Pseudomonas sp. 5B4]
MITLNLNGKDHQLDATDDMPLLWAIRDIAGYTGTKFGCGMGVCGACTIHINGEPARSCVTPIGSVVGQPVTTIDNLHSDPVGQVVQQAWLDNGVAQCGFCQGGQIMSATALLKSNPAPSDAQIEDYMAGNICRCGTYNRIKTAIHQAATHLKEAKA